MGRRLSPQGRGPTADHGDRTTGCTAIRLANFQRLPEVRDAPHTVGRFAAMLHVDPESPLSPVARTLLAQLSRELAERYPENADGGPGNITPDDTAVPRSIFLVAWFGSDAVGCGALRPFDAVAGTAEIKRLFVAPTVRGKGIGREILRELEKHAHGFGYTRLCLETGVRQPEAVALYDTEGFAPFPKYPPYENNPHSLCFAKNLAVAGPTPSGA